MKKPAIRVHIEELVLHGFAANDRYAIADALEHELSRLLAVDFATPLISFTGNSDRPRVDAGTFHAQSDAKPNSIGAQIAQAVHGGVTR